MFGKSKKAESAPAAGKGSNPNIKIGAAIFGEDEVELKELHIKGLRIANPGEGNIITGQKFHFMLRLGEGEKATTFRAEAFAVTASDQEVIGKLYEMDDDEKRLVALRPKALRAAGVIK